MMPPSHGAEDYVGEGSRQLGKAIPWISLKTPVRGAWSKTLGLKLWSMGPNSYISQASMTALLLTVWLLYAY